MMKAKLSTLLLILGLTVAALVWGQAPELTPKSARETDTAAPPTVPPQTPAEMTAADVEAFLNGIVPLQLERENITGATISSGALDSAGIASGDATLVVVTAQIDNTLNS